MVNHFNKQSITFPSYDPRAWKLAVDGHDALCMAQSCHITQLNL